jgi:hypothetical protein
VREAMNNVIDLTRISVDFQLEFDTLDAVLLVTTGGIGYLARAAYRHFSDKAARDLELQRGNFVRIVEEAQQKGAHRMIIRVNPNVPIFAPSGGELNFLERGPDYNEIELTFG